MLAESLPTCPCGKHDYSGGGGYVGPGLAYTCFTCTHCNRGVMEIHPWVFFGPDKTLEAYTNDIVLPFRRHLQETNGPYDVLPQIPDDLTVFYRKSKEEWVELDRKASKQMIVPEDPIAVHHRQFWAATVKELGAREIPNRYYDDPRNNEPWYEYNVLDAKVVFGPRKRVISIQVTRDTPFQCGKIAEIAKRDNVTFYADNGWQPWETKEAKSIEVHAWGKEKFDEYLGWIMWELGRTMGREART